MLNLLRNILYLHVDKIKLINYSKHGVENGREAGCSCRAWNGEEEKNIHYVHKRMELNSNKILCFFYFLLFELEAFIFRLKFFRNYRDMEKEETRKKIKKICQKCLKVKVRGRMDEDEKLLSWRVEREGHGEEMNAIARLIFYFF